MSVLILQLRESSIASGVLSGGVTYTRWGHNACPRVSGTRTIYTGRMAGAHYSHTGGGANYLCLPNDSKYHTLNTIPQMFTLGSMAQNTNIRFLVVMITMYHVLFAMLQQGQLK